MKCNFAKILKELMADRNLNQVQLAELLDIRQSQVSNLLNGKSKPQYYTIRKICTELQVSADFLLELENL